MAEQVVHETQAPPISERRAARLRLLARIRQHREEILRSRGGVPFSADEIDSAIASVRGGDAE